MMELYGGRHNMKEEDVTKTIMNYLLAQGWQIICYDFPQSGTGRVLHPNDRNNKTLGAIIPDIVAIKDDVVVVFENKSHFVQSDFDKIDFLRHSVDYTNSWNSILQGHEYSKFYYGIGLPMNDEDYVKAEKNKNKVDFIVYINADGLMNISGNIIF